MHCSSVPVPPLRRLGAFAPVSRRTVPYAKSLPNSERMTPTTVGFKVTARRTTAHQSGFATHSGVIVAIVHDPSVDSSETTPSSRITGPAKVQHVIVVHRRRASRRCTNHALPARATIAIVLTEALPAAIPTYHKEASTIQINRLSSTRGNPLAHEVPLVAQAKVDNGRRRS